VESLYIIKKADVRIKRCVLSESESGYVWNMVICCGKATDTKERENLGHANKVFVTL
jgi:hypothetical protein